MTSVTLDARAEIDRYTDRQRDIDRDIKTERDRERW